MKLVLKEQAISRLNALGKDREPFLFVINADCSEFIIEPLHAVNASEISYSMEDDFLTFRNYQSAERMPQSLLIEKELIETEVYRKAFDMVYGQLTYGNSFLVNLTAATRIRSNFDFRSIFEFSRARYKLFVANKFMCFSPESFVRITEEGRVSSFPMKGTIEASKPDAAHTILNDLKEKYEHTTIVDLIRNDLSKVCDKVWVERFRYLDTIKRHDGSELLQVSSEVSGLVPDNWQSHIGDILVPLLPAGSVTGAPKEKTIEIIKKAEQLTYSGSERGFYTGIFGIFDGRKLDSAVMIRFIEQTPEGLVFKSGGGITSRSSWQSEYNELISKVYVPIL